MQAMPRGRPPWREVADLARQRLLAAQPAVKLAIREAGWYRVTYEDLVEVGFDAAVVPVSLRLFLHGRKQALAVAVWASSGMGNAPRQAALLEAWIGMLFAGEGKDAGPTLGEARCRRRQRWRIAMCGAPGISLAIQACGSWRCLNDKLWQFMVKIRFSE
jgi:hypothetical protein